jgi:hypothetical protein
MCFVVSACTAALVILGACSGSSGGSTLKASASSSTTTTTEHVTPSTVAGQPDTLHPSQSLTPGATFPGVTAAQVCVSGYSTSVRDVSSSERDQVFAEYGLKNVDRSQYDVDHLISLELGGSNDITNLWPEPLNGSDAAKSKDTVENRLHDLVCSGQLALTDAQAAIVQWDKVDLAALASTTTTAPPVTQPPTTTPPSPAPPPAAAPTTAAPTTPGNGATALCNDGTYSYAAHHQSACSHHGGVAIFYK